MKKSGIFILLLIIPFFSLGAQNVEATIDTIQMLIGEQAHVSVTVTAKDGSAIVFPGYERSQQLTPGVEVLDSTATTKKELDNGQAVWTKVYTLTSFDDSLYYLPPFKISVNGKDYESKSLALKVMTVDVDTTKLDQFFPPKDVQDNPFVWSEWKEPFWLSVLMLLLLVTAVYFFIRLKQNKPVITRLKIIHRLLPHQKALKEIETIKAERLTTSENTKEYYTKLTDTLRKYIQERYCFSAMEMTSQEIIDRLLAEKDTAKLDELTQLFRTADLVKFAKYTTMINENDANLMSAIAFINDTKRDDQPTEQKVAPQLSEKDEKAVKTRRTLKALITIMAIASAALLIIIIMMIYRLLA